MGVSPVDVMYVLYLALPAIYALLVFVVISGTTHSEWFILFGKLTFCVGRIIPHIKLSCHCLQHRCVTLVLVDILDYARV